MTDNDPNEAYEVQPVPAELRGPPPDWWMVTCNGVRVKFFAPDMKADAERYCRDPEFRKSLARGPKAWEK